MNHHALAHSLSNLIDENSRCVSSKVDESRNSRKKVNIRTTRRTRMMRTLVAVHLTKSRFFLAFNTFTVTRCLPSSTHSLHILPTWLDQDTTRSTRKVVKLRRDCKTDVGLPDERKTVSLSADGKNAPGCVLRVWCKNIAM